MSGSRENLAAFRRDRAKAVRPDCVLLGLNKMTVLFFGVVLRDVAGANDIEVPAGAMMVLPGELLRPHVRAAGMGVFFYLVLRWRSTADAGCWHPP